jgi:hypothetical protein
MPHIIEVAIRHCASHAANHAAKEFKRALCRRVHDLVFSGRLNCAQIVEPQRVEPRHDVLAIALARPYRIQIVEQSVEIADGGGPDEQTQLMGPRHVRCDELDDVAMVQLAHRQAFLAQILDRQAAAPHDALAGEADGAMGYFVDTAKGAAAQVVEGS